MESKLEGALAIADSSKKENLMSRIVIENFGDWDNFRKIIEDAWKSIDYDPRENEFSQRRFTREILGSYANRINSADFRKLSNLVMKEIKDIERREKKVKAEDKKEDKGAGRKYVQRDINFDGGEKE